MLDVLVNMTLVIYKIITLGLAALALLIVVEKKFAPEIPRFNVIAWALLVFVGAGVYAYSRPQIGPWGRTLFEEGLILCFILYPVGQLFERNKDITLQKIFDRIVQHFKSAVPEQEVLVPIQQLRKMFIGETDMGRRIQSLLEQESDPEIVDSLMPAATSPVMRYIREDFIAWYTKDHDGSLSKFASSLIQLSKDEARTYILDRYSKRVVSGHPTLADYYARTIPGIERGIKHIDLLRPSPHGIPITEFLYEWGENDAFVRDPRIDFRAYYPSFQKLRVSPSIPEELRFEHHFILAGTGHGKSYTLKSMILDDLEKDKSIVVIDSQRDLINGTPSEPGLLDAVPEDRIVHIDPTDPTHWLALNVFDVGNSDLIEYVFSALDADMTSKQSTLYRFVARLLTKVPNATIHDMRAILEKGGLEKYKEHVSELSETAQSFFREFNTKEWVETKQQILRRLYAILENDTFAGMFSSPTTKIDLANEINAGKVILIDTSKGALGPAFHIFGRFWIAQLAKAMYARDLKKPTMLYIDEAHEYFSDETMLTDLFIQGRKFRVGMVVATQFLEPIPKTVTAAIMANTSIKYAGGTSATDANTMAKNMDADPDEIRSQTKGNFIASYKGFGSMPFRASSEKIKNIPTHDPSRHDRIRASMRDRYYIPHTTKSIVIGEVVNPDEVEERGNW